MITAAEFENDGRVLHAIRFTTPGGKPGYYDEQGRSLRRFFLRSPLKFVPRVTSGFSARRMHPVLHTARAHRGVDYGAPTGAPVIVGRRRPRRLRHVRQRQRPHGAPAARVGLRVVLPAPVGVRAGNQRRCSGRAGADRRASGVDGAGHRSASSLRSAEERRLREPAAGAPEPAARRSRPGSAMAAFDVERETALRSSRRSAAPAAHPPARRSRDAPVIMSVSMAALAPFRALRPAPSAAARVAAVPYDVVNTDEARALAAGNPLSFLHVSRAEIDLSARHRSVRATRSTRRRCQNFERLKSEAPLLIEDDAEPLRLPAAHGRALTQTGVAGCFSLDEYERDVIKKHERTRQDKEDDRTRHLLALRAQTGPGVPDLPRGAGRSTRSSSACMTASAALRLHRATACSTPSGASIAEDASAPRGRVRRGARAVHRRRPSSGGQRRARAADSCAGAAASAGEWDTFLAVAFPACPGADPSLQPRGDRIWRDARRPRFSARCGQRFAVKDGPASPARRGEVAMFLDGAWHTLVLGEAAARRRPAERLDVSRLQDVVLGPLLGSATCGRDKRIDFVGGAARHRRARVARPVGTRPPSRSRCIR